MPSMRPDNRFDHAPLGTEGEPQRFGIARCDAGFPISLC